MATRSRHGGFTLIELLVSMGLLAVIGTLCVQLIETSLDVWKKGEDQRDVLEQRLALQSVLSRDFENALGGEQGEFTADTRSTSFVRAILEGEEQRLLDDWRHRGLLPARYDQVIKIKEANYRQRKQAFDRGDSDRNEPEPVVWYDHVPHRGTARVTYEVVTDPLYKDPSIVALYRAAVPTGLGASVQRKDLLAAVKGDPGDDEGQAFRKVAGSLLLVEWMYRSEWTKSWSYPPQNFTTWSDQLQTFMRDGGSPTQTMRSPVTGWDSSRGTDSPLDDVFPEAVRLTLVVLGKEERARPWRLAEALGEPVGLKAASVKMRSEVYAIEGPNRRPPGDARFAKIGSEWVAVSDVERRSIAISGRGERGTKGKSHKVGTPVYFGSAMTLFLRLPVSTGGIGR